MSDAGAPPTEQQKQQQQPSAKLGCAVLLLAVVLVGGIVAAVVLTLKAGGDTLARIPLTDEPASVTIRVDAPKAITLWTELDVTHAGISPRESNDDLPHVIDYVVVVTRDGTRVVELRCNPFDSNFAKWSSKKESYGEDPGRAYDGRINGCAFDVPPGEYVVEARREWVGRDPRIRFAKTDLIVRGK